MKHFILTSKRRVLYFPFKETDLEEGESIITTSYDGILFTIEDENKIIMWDIPENFINKKINTEVSPVKYCNIQDYLQIQKNYLATFLANVSFIEDLLKKMKDNNENI
jgi:hypothetical protein